MQSLVLVLSAMRYDFPDEKDANRKVAGISVKFVNLGADPNPERGPKGFPPMTGNLPASHADLPSVPGYYTGHFNMSTSDGKIVLKLASLQHQGPAELVPGKEGK